MKNLETPRKTGRVGSYDLNRFRSVKCLNRAMSWNAWDISTALRQGRPRGKIPLENPWECDFRDS